MSSFHKQTGAQSWLLGFFQGVSLTVLKIRLSEVRREGVMDDGSVYLKDVE